MKKDAVKKEETENVILNEEKNNDYVHYSDDEINEYEKSILAKREEYENKKFLVPVSIEIVDRYIEFIENRAQWKYSEALGVIQCHKDLVDAKTEAKLNKNKNKIAGIMLSVTALEALNYFYSLVNDIGLTKATAYIEELQPLANVLVVAKKELQSIDAMEFKLSSMRQGLAIEEKIEEATKEA